MKLFLRIGFFVLAPLIYLIMASMAVGEPFSLGYFARQVFFYGVMLLIFQTFFTQPKIGIWIVLAFGGVAGVVYGLTKSTLAAWFMTLAWLILLLFLARGRNSWLVGGLAFAAGFVPVAIGQLESRFSEEEFFAALQVLILTGFWLLSLIAIKKIRPQVQHNENEPYLSPVWLGGLLIGVLIVGGWVVHAYQNSFYTTQVPEFPGISSETPFICGIAPGSGETYDGEFVFQQYLAQIEALPVKGTPEWGMLTLGTRNITWANAFREGLLDEAARGAFTGPANSVKSVQLDAAIRAYYFSRVREVFPELFSQDDEVEIRAWFAAINHRALTVEWVDWMYALAFSKWPEGLYENQENGTGLLAILETEGLSAPELETENQTYLADNLRGWQTRFRNTDDAYLYQAIWFFSAYYQSLYQSPQSSEKVHQSFEWLLLQALPDGAALTYNHPLALNPAGVAYLGATLTGDSNLLWLAGRSVEELARTDVPAYPVTGVDAPLSLSGTSPTQGTCLLYGDSGLPNQFGPLAPDKIVFRDGWERDSTYLLLNLRFTGWHRYKGTNTIPLVYRDEPLAADMLEGELVSWLPIGRKHFRDKRIPRENLNGFVIERSGMSAVLYGLSGIGGPWAQDPPYYTTINQFENREDEDVSITTLEDWRGWTQTREIHFFHRGPLVIFDRAEGPKGISAAVVWHLLGTPTTEENRIALQGGELGEFVMVSLDEGQMFTQSESGGGESLALQVGFKAEKNGNLNLVSVFLPPDWKGAIVRFEAGEWVITSGDKSVRVKADE